MDKLARKTPNSEQREININLKYCTYEDILRFNNIIMIKKKWHNNGKETKLGNRNKRNNQKLKKNKL